MAYRIAYDPQCCINCYTCMVQCGVENRVRIERDTGIGPERTDNMPLPHLFYLTPVAREFGTYPNARRITEFQHCQHCENAPCAQACPTKTIEVRPNGLVVIHEGGCIGCRTCVEACPWDVPKLDPVTNKAYKCVGCFDRVEAGMEPACVSACPSVALFAGDGQDVAAEAKRRATEYAQVHGKDFIAYGTEKVSDDVGTTGWVTIAPKEDAGFYGLMENPATTTMKIREASASIAGIGSIGLAGAAGAHFIYWLGKRKKAVKKAEAEQSAKTAGKEEA